MASKQKERNHGVVINNNATVDESQERHVLYLIICICFGSEVDVDISHGSLLPSSNSLPSSSSLSSGALDPTTLHNSEAAPEIDVVLLYQLEL